MLSNCTCRNGDDTTHATAVPRVKVCEGERPIDIEEVVCDNPSVLDYQRIADLRSLHVVTLRDSDLTEGAVKALKSLPNLEELFLSIDNLDDASLSRLHGLTGLNRLGLVHTKVSDAGVKALVRSFPDLEELGICYSAATDRGLSHLSRLRGLKKLWLCGKGFTTGALEVLSTLNGLTLIRILDTAIDIDAARHFARQRPEIEVHWEKNQPRAEPYVLR